MTLTDITVGRDIQRRILQVGIREIDPQTWILRCGQAGGAPLLGRASREGGFLFGIPPQWSGGPSQSQGCSRSHIFRTLEPVMNFAVNDLTSPWRGDSAASVTQIF